MKKEKVLMLGIIFCISMPFLSGCKVKQSDTLHKIHVGVAYYNQSDTFLNELIACFKEEMEKLDKEKIETTVTIRDAAGSQRTQNDQVKELIDAGCNVLCVNLVDRADPSDIIDMAKEKNVPIIFFNREPVAEDLMQWDGLYYVGADARILDFMAQNHRGIVIIGSGRGNYNKAWLEKIESLSAKGIVFVRASRVQQGIVIEDEYFDPDNICVPANTLSGQKARVLLMLSLAYTNDIKEIKKIFNEY